MCVGREGALKMGGGGGFYQIRKWDKKGNQQIVNCKGNFVTGYTRYFLPSLTNFK